MFKITRKLSHSKLLIIMIVALIIGPMNLYADNHGQSIMLKDLLPQYNNYQWTYSGSVEYSHNMAINQIIKNDTSSHYKISGSVYDASGGESDTDYSLTLDYMLQSDVIVQTKEEEAMMDSKYDSIELIRTPLQVGNTWNQDVENPDGSMTTLTSIITEVNDTEDGMIFTVRYEDINSTYYEERKIQENIGVINFVKLMNFEDEAYEMGYGILEENSGLVLDTSFQDLSGNEWYDEHISKLLTLNLIDGYPDDTFKGENEITVAEFIKITIESLSYYPDQPSVLWYDFYVSKAIEMQLIEEDEFDDYNRPISRQEMTKIIVNALGEDPQSGQLNFSDAAEIEAEYQPYIYTAVDLGIIVGYPSDNTFRASDPTTRGEASKLIAYLVKERIDVDEFDAEATLSLEAEFKARLFQETEDDSWVVKNYDDMETLIDYVAEISDRPLAKTYVENYYEYDNGDLTLPPKDGPTWILENEAYFLEKIHPRAYRLSQETTTEMLGHYTLTIDYAFENNTWIIKDRAVEVH